jgi:hypothetical protein
VVDLSALQFVLMGLPAGSTAGNGTRSRTSWRRIGSYVSDSAGVGSGSPMQSDADGAAITYVARQLGHRDASTTLRIYAHWLPDASRTRAVDLLDGTQPAATPAQPAAVDAEWKTALSAVGSVVSRGGIEPPTRRLRVCCSAN